ncbi:MAG: SpoIID/LytB domain-containing protein [Roseburia sp.]|nr:SpoIID/LytB domain-containing protein [Roseburia sp.]MCM1242654.1 SpoIID/LytB domain-containing protein [Roseburia sp.]
MNLFRIVRKRTNKSGYNGSPYRDVPTVLLFVFLLPYVISCLWGHSGVETEYVFGKAKEEETTYIDEEYEIVLSGKQGTKHMTMQEYLLRKLKITMPKSKEGIMYETEALKAQAILLRTEVWGFFLSGEKTVVLEDDVSMYEQEESYSGEEEQSYAEAVMTTDGIYLAYAGQPVKAAFFPVSNGQTRDAAEVWTGDIYPYLRRVECEQDILAGNYQSLITYDKKEYCLLIGELFDMQGKAEEIWGNLELTRDSSEYVINVKINDLSCDGETFRYALGLASADFRAQWEEESVTFHVKGAGHGFGLSQYGANQKAVSGDTFNQILAAYFFQAELVKIE